MSKPRREIRINGKRMLNSHYVWHANTGHWPIFPDEVVHHIDGDTLNDEFTNLQLMSNSEHSIMHNNGKNNFMYGKTGENNPNFGKTHTEETKAKMSAATRERWKTPEFRNRMSGENHPRWKGDDVTPYDKRRRELRSQGREK